MLFAQEWPCDPGNYTMIVNLKGQGFNRFWEMNLELLMDKFWCWKNKAARISRYNYGYNCKPTGLEAQMGFDL